MVIGRVAPIPIDHLVGVKKIRNRPLKTNPGLSHSLLEVRALSPGKSNTARYLNQRPSRSPGVDVNGGAPDGPNENSPERDHHLANLTHLYAPMLPLGLRYAKYRRPREAARHTNLQHPKGENRDKYDAISDRLCVMADREHRKAGGNSEITQFAVCVIWGGFGFHKVEICIYAYGSGLET